MFGLFARKTDGPDYASFERRMLASVIDTIIMGFPLAFLLQYIWNPAAEMQGVVNQIRQDYRSGNLSPEQFSHALQQYIFFGGGGVLYIQDVLFQVGVLGIFVVLFWIYRRGTPGKLLLRMEVVDAKTLGQPSKKQCVVRYLGYIPAAATLMLGFLWILFNKKRQGLHDVMAGTVVIVRPRKTKNGSV